jgi:multisubunit Na+/H+ antiporter MnhB subunit
LREYTHLTAIFVAVISVSTFILAIKLYDWLICLMFNTESHPGTVFASFCLSIATTVLYCIYYNDKKSKWEDV